MDLATKLFSQVRTPLLHRRSRIATRQALLIVLGGYTVAVHKAEKKLPAGFVAASRPAQPLTGRQSSIHDPTIDHSVPGQDASAHFTAVASLTRMAMTLLVVSPLMVGSVRRRKQNCGLNIANRVVAVSTCCLGDGDILAEAKAAAESAKLELEAAKIRVEIAEMERAEKVQRRTARAGAMLSGSLGVDGVYSVSLDQLPARLKEHASFEATFADVGRLGAAVGLSSVEAGFSFNDLASAAFDEELSRLIAEKRSKGIDEELRQAAQAREAAQAAQSRQAAQAAQGSQADTSQGTAPAPPVNDDRSQGTRILASLAYILPLVDSVQFGVLLVQLLPITMPLFALLLIPNAIVNAIPFGSFILFTIWILLGSNRDLPRLVRFNLQQAIIVDVAFFFPNILISLVNGGAISPEFGAFFFLGLLALCSYCVYRNFQGEYPDNLPFISDLAKNSVDGPANFGGAE